MRFNAIGSPIQRAATTRSASLAAVETSPVSALPSSIRKVADGSDLTVSARCGSADLTSARAIGTTPRRPNQSFRRALRMKATNTGCAPAISVSWTKRESSLSPAASRISSSCAASILSPRHRKHGLRQSSGAPQALRGRVLADDRRQRGEGRIGARGGTHAPASPRNRRDYRLYPRGGRQSTRDRHRYHRAYSSRRNPQDDQRKNSAQSRPTHVAAELVRNDMTCLASSPDPANAASVERP